MNMKNIHLLPTVAISLLLLSASGCSKKASVPDDAKLVWQGITDSPDEWRNLMKENEGTLYLVDAKSGELKEVRTLWKEKPIFTFTVEKNKEYQLYFKSELSEK